MFLRKIRHLLSHHPIESHAMNTGTINLTFPRVFELWKFNVINKIIKHFTLTVPSMRSYNS